MEPDLVYPGGVVHPGWVMLAKALIEAPSASTKELALILGVSTHTVKKWRRTPEFSRFALWYTDKVFLPIPAVRPGDIPPEPAVVRAQKLKEEISEYAVEMFDRLKDIVETTEDEGLVVSVARDIMDRAGHGAIRKVQSEKRALVLTPELYAEFERRAREASQGPIVDVTPIPSLPVPCEVGSLSQDSEG